MTIKDLNPRLVWHYFEQITQIPRPSKKEEKIISYLLGFAKEHQLDVKKDNAGNVLITKAATKGYENLPTVILQSHIDMVCEKNEDTVHDFDNDPISTYVDGDWLKAKGTTLGADNGMGVAAELAILASDDIEHGKLECLFTVDEETGLTGAFALAENFLTGDVLINLDTEEEGELYIGCAGGKGTKATFKYETLPPHTGYYWFRVDVKGLNGGHSGAEIHKGLGNANKLLNRYLWAMAQKTTLSISEIAGGNLHNAIAREAYAIVGVPVGDKDAAHQLFEKTARDIKEELKVVDPNVELVRTDVAEPATVLDKDTVCNLLNAICVCPHGVLAMSHEIEGLVEASTNLASIKMDTSDNTILIGTSQRSSTESLKNYAANMVASAFTLAKAKVEHTDGYPSWKPNPQSQIVEISRHSYKKMFGIEPEIKAIHAGLECGLFLEKYPHLDMVSCGPTITDAHSPAEQVYIPSVEKWWDLLLDILKSVPAKK